MKNVKVKAVVKYAGHNITDNGIVNFTVKSSYSELTNVVQLLQMLSNDISIKVKIVDQSVTKLGLFRLKNIAISDDGSGKIKFTSITEVVEINNLNNLPLRGEQVEEFAILFETNIEEE